MRGHSLDGSVETQTLVPSNAVLYYFKELADLGRAESMTQLFFKEIHRLRNKGVLPLLKGWVGFFHLQEGG